MGSVNPLLTSQPPTTSYSSYTSWLYSKELIAIIGGVLGFWGGVGSLGTMFLMILLSQKYCCVEKEDKDEKG